MKHIDEKDLSAYLDHEVVGTKNSEIEIHLALCKRCRKMHKNWIAIQGLIRLDRPIEPTPFFYSKLIYRIQNEGIPLKDEIWSIAKWALGSSAVAISVLLIVALLVEKPTSGNDTKLELQRSMENRLIAKAVNYDVTITNDDFLEMVYESNGVTKK